MIRFGCEQCAHKISVQDEHTDKRVKCPKCGSVGTVPAKSTIVDFHCESCGQIISVPQVHAGKKCKCPKCKSIVVVPTRPEAPAKSISTVRFTCSTCNQEIEEPETSRGKLVECPHCSSYVPVPSEKNPAQKAEASVQPGKKEGVFEKRLEAPQQPETEIQAEETEPADERRLPWFIDIFLYPTSPSGLISLITIVVIPMLIALVTTLMGPLGIAVGLPGFFLNLAIGLYLLWFFTECVRDSANGGTRAPEAFATGSLDDMWSQALHIIGCYLILLGPVGFYHIFTQKTDAIFWLLLAYGAFLFPMGLLACIMFDSVRGLNPILLVGSIFSTFFHYFGLVLLIVAIVLAFSALPRMETDNTEPPQPLNIPPLIVGGIFYGLAIYIVLVVAHLIGRFYWRNQEKLNWEV